MWVAFLVVLLATGEVGVQAAPTPYPTEAACNEANQGIEPRIKESDQVKAYVLKCAEVKKEDVKKAGKDA